MPMLRRGVGQEGDNVCKEVTTYNGRAQKHARVVEVVDYVDLEVVPLQAVHQVLAAQEAIKGTDHVACDERTRECPSGNDGAENRIEYLPDAVDHCCITHERVNPSGLRSALAISRSVTGPIAAWAR